MMPGNWTGYSTTFRNAPHAPGLAPSGGMGAVASSPRAPMKSGQAAAQQSFNLIPDQPSPREIARTVKHLTGRPADPEEVQQLLDDTNVTYGDFAPGGQVAESGPGQTAVR